MADKDFVVKNGLSVNGSILVVNAGTKSVGINTSSPDANLTISGTANVSGNLTVSGTMFGNLVGTANNANNLGGTVASSYALKTYANSAADQAYSNAQTYSSNADNISSGTLNTARLPATANVSTALNVGANVTVTNDTTKFHTYGLIFNGAASGNANRLQFRYDKAATTLTYTGNVTANTGSINYFFFGGNNRNVGDTQGTFMDGYIGEVLIWTRALNSSEILAAETYIANKWAI